MMNLSIYSKLQWTVSSFFFSFDFDFGPNSSNASISCTRYFLGPNFRNAMSLYTTITFNDNFKIFLIAKTHLKHKLLKCANRLSMHIIPIKESRALGTHRFACGKKHPSNRHYTRRFGNLYKLTL